MIEKSDFDNAVPCGIMCYHIRKSSDNDICVMKSGSKSNAVDCDDGCEDTVYQSIDGVLSAVKSMDDTTISRGFKLSFSGLNLKEKESVIMAVEERQSQVSTFKPLGDIAKFMNEDTSQVSEDRQLV